MNKHLDILAVLYVISSVFCLLGGVFAFVVIAGGGLMSGEADAMWITAGIGTAIGAFLVLLALPGFIGAYGLTRRRPWARMLVLILGFLNLFNFPLGTALGVYTIWVLMNDEVVPHFAAT